MNERKKFLLRLPADLWDDIQRLAAADLRSANVQIEILLREAVRQRTKTTAQTTENKQEP